MRGKRTLTGKVIEIVALHGPVWKGDPSVKAAGIPAGTFRDIANDLAKQGIFSKSIGGDGLQGRPRAYYQLGQEIIKV